MPLTLKEMCQRALRESAEFDVPATIVANVDPTAVRLLAAADRTGRALHRKLDWQALNQTHTFDTESGASEYDLPADYQRFISLTFWDRTNLAYIKGPVSAAEFEALRSGSIAGASAFQSYFRIAAGKFVIYPEPADVRTIACQYVGTGWVDNNGDGEFEKEYFEADTNTCAFDDDLMVLGVRYRFLAASGAPHDEERTEYEDFERRAIANDGGSDVIGFGVRDVRLGPLGTGNLPETGYGT